jgi:hypothetical protein
MNDQKKISFSINTINVLGFGYKDPLDQNFDLDSVNKLPFELKFALNYRWNIDKNLFGVLIDFIYVWNNKDLREEMLSLSYIIEYTVIDLKYYFIVRDSADFDMDLALESTLVGIAISTGRGILFEKSKGTIFQRLIIPPIVPTDFMLSRRKKETKSE